MISYNINMNIEFKKNGFLILKNFISESDFRTLCKKINKDIEDKFNNKDLNSYGGSIIGNLNLVNEYYSEQILNILLKNDLDKIIKNISGNSVSEFNIRPGGNLNFQYKYNQHFHADGGFDNPYLIINIGTENITELNGPLEIVQDTHLKRLPYWKFLFKRKKKKILLSEGDILIRKSNLWHRGTINLSKKPRYLLSYILEYKTENNNKFNLIKKNYWKINNNMFGNNIIEKIKEIIYTKFSFVYSCARLIASILNK